MGEEIKSNHRRSLPRDVISKILIELPAKSVIRFSCVSKTWLSIIKDPYLAKCHHARSYTRPGGIKLIVCTKLCDERSNTSTYNFFHTDPEGESPLKPLTPPSAGLSFHLINSKSKFVHGLLFAHNYVWNPTTNESIVLPPISLNTFIDGDDFDFKCKPEYFFGFDSSKNAYKVLCILHDYIVGDHKRMCKILDLGGSSWRDIEFVPSQLLDCHCLAEDSCSIDNLIYFGCSKFVLTFDVRCEKFETIPVPNGLTDSYHVIQVGGCLSLINDEFETVWILEDVKKHQWRSESLTIGRLLKMNSFVYMNIKCTPLGAIHTGEILFQIVAGKELYYYYYDIEKREGWKGRMVEGLGNLIKGIHSDLPDTFSVMKHVESIYRLK